MPLFLLPVAAFAKKHAALLFILVAAITILGSIMFVYSRAHDAGKREVELRVEKQHTETIREVRSDERLAQEVADQISKTITELNARQHTETSTILKEIHDELPAPDPSAPAPVAVSASVREKSNQLVNRANRAADDASAASRAEPAGTPLAH